MQANLPLFHRGSVVTIKLCQRLLGLMASSVVAIPQQLLAVHLGLKHFFPLLAEGASCSSEDI